MKASLLWIIAAVCALEAATPAEAARQWRRLHEKEILAEYMEFLAIPNVARDIERPFIGKNADWIIAAFRKRGIEARKLTAGNAPPAVFAGRCVPG